MASGTNHRSKNARRARVRAAGVAGAVGAAVIAWAVAELLGVDLEVTPGTDDVQTVGAGSVILVAAAASLAGWGALAVLERLWSRGRQAWTVAAVVVLVASLAGPLAGVTTAATVSLAVMHLAVGAVLLPALARTWP